MNEKVLAPRGKFRHNPDHTIGTCSECGKEMTWNVPRLGALGGYIHKESCEFGCAVWPSDPLQVIAMTP